MRKIRLILIEDNRLLREGITAILKKETDINLVGTFGGRDFNISKISDLKPSIILLDLGLPSLNSFELVRSLKKKYHNTKIIIMGIFPIKEEILQFVEIGVSGFILKDASIQDFLNTIRSIYKGEKFIPPNLVDSLFSQIVDSEINSPKKSSMKRHYKITKREHQVIDLVANGLTNKEIGEKLFLSTSTIKSHIHNILEKLTIHNRIEIAKFAHTDIEYQKLRNSISYLDEDDIDN